MREWEGNMEKDKIRRERKHREYDYSKEPYRMYQ
jgi:hypothetical protein